MHGATIKIFRKYIFEWACLQATYLLDKGRAIPDPGLLMLDVTKERLKLAE
jgi:hypothetical protein